MQDLRLNSLVNFLGTGFFLGRYKADPFLEVSIRRPASPTCVPIYIEKSDLYTNHFILLVIVVITGRETDAGAAAISDTLRDWVKII